MPAVVMEEQRNPEPRAEEPKIVRLGDVLNVVRGASPRPKGDPKYFGGDIPWIMIGDITREPGKYLSRTREHVTTAGAAKSRYLKAGTLILSNSGTVCVPRILAVDGCIHDGFVAFPDLPKSFDKNYLYWFFEHIRPSIIEANRQGITQVNLNTSIVREIRLPMVSLDQQRSIVAEIEKQFSRLDEAVASLKRVKANLKRYKAAVLKAAVEGRLVPTEAELARREGRGYETGTQLLHCILEIRRNHWKGKGKYKEPAAPDTADLPELPEGWAWAAVTQITDVASGNTPSGVLEAVKQAGEVPWFKVGDMNHNENQQVMRHADGWLSLAEAKELGLRLFQADTVLFPKRGGAIATNKKRRLESVGCADLNVMGITPASEIASYFFAWFDGVDLAGLADGSNVPQINHNDIEPLLVPLPPLTEQWRIVAEVDRRLSFVRGVEAEVDANLKRAAALRQATLSDAFSWKRDGISQS